MIYCITQPMDQYDVTFQGHTVGLNMTYGHHPPLLNLILLTTLPPFGYEKGTDLEPPDRIVQVDHEKWFYETLTQEVNKKKVTWLVSNLTPIEFYNHIKDVDIDHLMICGMFSERQESIKMITAARAVAWALNYRGPVARKGNVTTAAFGKNSVMIPADMRQHHTGLVDAITKSRD